MYCDVGVTFNPHGQKGEENMLFSQNNGKLYLMKMEDYVMAGWSSWRKLEVEYVWSLIFS